MVRKKSGDDGATAVVEESPLPSEIDQIIAEEKQLVTELADPEKKLLQASETILMRYAEACFERLGPGTDSHQLVMHAWDNVTSDESFCLRAAGFHDRDAFKREVLRCLRVVVTRREAGTSEDRRLAREAAAVAVKRRAERCPELDAIIAKAQSEKQALESAAFRLEHVAEQQSRAVVRLRTLIPSHMQEEIRRLRQSYRDRTRGAGTLQTQIERADLLASLQLTSGNDRQKIREYLGSTPDAVGMFSEVDGDILPNKWREYVQRLRSEVPQLRERLAKIEAAEAECAAAVEAIEMHYVP